MSELMYDISSFTIAAVLFISMLLMIEMGYRIGRGHNPRSNESSKSHINAILGALLGIHALLRGQLLPEEVREASRSTLSRYLDVRIETSRVAMSEQMEREQLLGVAGHRASFVSYILVTLIDLQAAIQQTNAATIAGRSR